MMACYNISFQHSCPTTVSEAQVTVNNYMIDITLGDKTSKACGVCLTCVLVEHIYSFD